MKAQDKHYLRNAARYTKEFLINSPERIINWLILLGCILSVIGLSFIYLNFVSGINVFWMAMQEKNTAVFLSGIESLSVIMVGYVVTSKLKDLLIGLLSNNWRDWLTNKLVDQLTSKDNKFLDLARNAKEVPNPGLRIQESVANFIDLTMSLSFDMIKSLSSLIMFSRSLYILGGSLSFVLFGLSLTVPGYLVWAALLFAGLASTITVFVGGNLSDLKKDQAKFEAEFRAEIDQLINEAESIAQERGVKYYRLSLKNKFDRLMKNTYYLLRTNISVELFQDVYNQIMMFLPFVVAAPLYFYGGASWGDLMQIGESFQQVVTAFSFFVNSYVTLSDYESSIKLIAELEDAFDGHINISPKNIVNKPVDNQQNIEIKNLSLTTPKSTVRIMQGLNLVLSPGKHILIKGKSGLGKSTLFKVIAGTWGHGEGQVSTPSMHKMSFLAQKPSLPNSTLRAVLAYPDPIETYQHDDYIDAIKKIGGLDKFINDLDKIANWSACLSGGEQERVSAARALLKKPEWLFLDEATASLDSEGEDYLYSQLRRLLPKTTFVSIAHRDTVNKFHDQIITLDLDASGQLCAVP